MRTDRPFVGFDTETSGVNTEQAVIVTACLGHADPTSRSWTPTNWMLRQDQPIPADATAVHGITTEQANQEGVDHTTGLEQIRAELYRYWDEDLPVCAYNAVFDLTVLDRECRRHGLGPLEVRGLVIDPLVIDKHVDRYRKGSRKLVDVAAHHGIILTADDAHGAEPDARAATRLAWKMAPLIPDDPAEAMRWQADAYADQRVSFASYLRRQGKHEEAVHVAASTAWPLVEVQH